MPSSEYGSRQGCLRVWGFTVSAFRLWGLGLLAAGSGFRASGVHGSLVQGQGSVDAKALLELGIPQV